MLTWTLAAVALAGADPVTEATYLWETGQDAKALEVIEAAHRAAPTDLGVHRVRIAMQVGNGAGGPLEAVYRDWFSQEKDDPLRRVALAFALAYRGDAPGPWCDDADALVSGLLGKGDAQLAYWARRAALLAHERCDREPDVDRAELLKIADAGGPGAEEARVLGLTNGYVGTDAPAAISDLLEANPRLVDRLLPLWDDGAGGPALIQAQNAVLGAAKTAAKSTDPIAVLAAARLYRGIGKEKLSEKAELQLASLDAGANSKLRRDLDTVNDPPIYDRIDQALGKGDAAAKLAALDALKSDIPDKGGAAAHYQAVQVDLLAEANRQEDAFVAARKAWQLMPENPVYAETFARKAAAVDKDQELALQALDLASANPNHPRHSIHLLVRAKLNQGLERFAAAEKALWELQSREPTGRVVHRNLGDLYDRMNNKDAALVHYVVAMHDPEAEGDDRSRKRIEELLGKKDPYLEGAAALIGKPLVIEGLAPAPGKPRVLLAVPSWHPATKGEVTRLKEWAATGKGSATVVVLDVGDEGVGLVKTVADPVEVVRLGPAAARAMRADDLPYWVVLDAKGKVKAAGSGSAITPSLP